MLIKFDNLKDLLIFNIKYYRYVNKFLQEKLAELCKLSPRYISYIESVLHCPTILKIESIAKALSIEPYILFQNPPRDKKIINKMNTSRQYNQKRRLKNENHSLKKY